MSGQAVPPQSLPPRPSPPMAHERASRTLLKVVAFASRSFSTLFAVFFGFAHLSNKRHSLSLSLSAVSFTSALIQRGGGCRSMSPCFIE